MKLSEELRARGLNKSRLADLLDVSRQTVHRMGEEVSDEVLAILSEIEIQGGKPWDLPDDELKEIIRNFSSVGRYEVCKERGWRVWELNEAVTLLVERNPCKKPENGYDLSKYVKGGIVDKETGELK